MNLQQYRLSLAWSAEELARRAGINAQTVRRIERGSPTFPHTASAIAAALSRGLGREIKVEDIEGLEIRD
ncbi:MAG TPA: helix-turn-helix transcriptional regulator [Ktedonobacteraceae bacterium]|nr:helix-turn-helix transcriptional regulator [Ktedonobacteraceae bacterium]